MKLKILKSLFIFLLTNAFKKRNKSERLFLAADLSHYIADAPHLNEQNKKNYKIELKAWQNGKILNLANGPDE